MSLHAVIPSPWAARASLRWPELQPLGSSHASLCIFMTCTFQDYLGPHDTWSVHPASPPSSTWRWSLNRCCLVSKGWQQGGGGPARKTSQQAQEAAKTALLTWVEHLPFPPALCLRAAVFPFGASCAESSGWQELCWVAKASLVLFLSAAFSLIHSADNLCAVSTQEAC